MLDDENVNINEKVVTLQDLYERRKILIEKRRQIFNNQKEQISPIPKEVEKVSDRDDFMNVTSEFDTLPIVYGQEPITDTENISNPNHIEINVNIVPQSNDGDFSSDDSVADPSFVPLAEITNLQALSPDNIQWFPERDIMEGSDKNKKQRKRKGNPNSWKRQKNKRQRMLGQEYVGFQKVGSKYVQNEFKPARMMGPLCMSKRCFSGKSMYCSKLTEEIRKNIFDTYWKMSWEEKKMYVCSMIDKKPTKRKTKDCNSRRSDSKIYYLKVNNKKERVCLNTFLETLGIREWTVRYWLGDKTETVKTTSVQREDVSVKVSKKELVKKYLNALPKLPSHYCRQSTSKLYLEPLIQTKSQLYRLYVDYSQPRNDPVTSRKLFEDVLLQENIGIFQPKKDACDICSAHKVGNLSDVEYKKHTELKEMARKEKNSDKEAAQKGTIHAITADLQAVKLCPFLNASALYFKTKLAVHNFSVYNLRNNKATCYWFDETACDLKSSTYATFFVDYVTKLLDDDSKDVVIFSDGCTAQNRNSVVSNALLRLAMARNVTITQKYLEKGHTQMEVDSVHSVIERKMKNREIFLPTQYATIT
jgi:hypothetical protein